jgi:kynurenine formamidase
MKKLLLPQYAILLISVAGFPQSASRKIIDLTYPFSDETVYWPTAEGFRLKIEAAGITDKGFYYAANSFCAAEHGGTHLDAPVHFAQGMPAVDEVPLERLVAPGSVIDMRVPAAADRDYLVSVQDIQSWEKKNGRLARNTILLLQTGWGKFYPDRGKYLGTDRRGPEAIAELHFPGLDPSAARWLVANRKIAAIGIDTASIDRGQSQLFESHQILFKAGVPALENVANMEGLPAKGFELIALPMKIKGGSGGPLRIIAILGR